MSLKNRLAKLERALVGDIDQADERYSANLRARLFEIKVSRKRMERSRSFLDLRTDEEIAHEAEAEIQAHEKEIADKIAARLKEDSA